MLSTTGTLASDSRLATLGVEVVWVLVMGEEPGGDRAEVVHTDGRGCGLDQAPLANRIASRRVEGRIGEQPEAAELDKQGHRYERPLTAMRRYLDAMDRAPYLAPMPDPMVMTRVLGALGPRMLALAAEVADGAHPYLVPVEHTEQAREILGPTKLLCPEVAVVVTPDQEGARRVARAHLTTYLQLVNYRSNLARLGFDAGDLTGGGSDRLVDALVAWGPVERVARRVHEHLDAGADHVAIQVLTADPDRLPLAEWTELAAALRLSPRPGPAQAEE